MVGTPAFVLEVPGLNLSPVLLTAVGFLPGSSK
jgi:hypothetical protein